MEKNQLRNRQFLNDLSRKATINSQLSYYWNLSIAAVFASIATKVLDFDWKFPIFGLVVFVFSVLNYLRVNKDLTALSARGSRMEFNDTNVFNKPEFVPPPPQNQVQQQQRPIPEPGSPRMQQKKMQTNPIPKAHSPMLTQRRPQTQLSQPSVRPVISLRSPENNQENFDLSRASKIASETMNVLTPPPANAPAIPRESRLFSPASPNISGFPANPLGPYAGLNTSYQTGLVQQSAYPSREYHISPISTKPVSSNAVQSKDALQSLGLTQIPDEWIDELKTILGKHLHVIMDIYHQCREDMIQVLRKAMTVPVNMGGISEKDFHQAVILLDNADQERTERLENGHPVSLRNLMEYVKNTNMIMNFDEFSTKFEFTLSFFRLCQSIIKQKQQNISKIQEIERMKNDIVEDTTNSMNSFQSNLFSSVNNNQNNLLKSNKKGFIIEKLQQLVNNSYEKKLIIQWKHPSSSNYSSNSSGSSTGFFMNDFFSSFGDSSSSSSSNPLLSSTNELLITDQEIVLALFLHRCNHLTQTLSGSSFFTPASVKLKASFTSNYDTNNNNNNLNDNNNNLHAGENAFSEEHLIFNYTIDLYRIIKLLQERNREEELSKMNSSNNNNNNNNNSSNGRNNLNNSFQPEEDDDYYNDFLNENSIVSFIYHTPSSLATDNAPPTGQLNHSMMNGININNPVGNPAYSSSTGSSSSSSSTIQEYMQSIKNPHFDIIKITFNGKKREIFKIDYTRNDCYESIIIFLLIIYFTTIFNYYHYDPTYMNYEDILENILEGGYRSTTTAGNDADGNNNSNTNPISFSGDAYNQRDFRIIKLFIEKIIPKYDLKHMLLRFYQQNIQQGNAQQQQQQQQQQQLQLYHQQQQQQQSMMMMNSSQYGGVSGLGPSSPVYSSSSQQQQQQQGHLPSSSFLSSSSASLSGVGQSRANFMNSAASSSSSFFAPF